MSAYVKILYRIQDVHELQANELFDTGTPSDICEGDNVHGTKACTNQSNVVIVTEFPKTLLRVLVTRAGLAT